MIQRSLSSLVAIYSRKHGPRLAAYLDYFQALRSLNDAIRYACQGKEGKIHIHQHRVGKEKLGQAQKELQRHAGEIASCATFGELLALVEDRTSSIDRFGILAVYDTSLRLGAYRDLWPEIVYLHAGTKKGCKALGVATKCKAIEMARLPKPIRLLEPYQAEDFLCIFKNECAGEDGKVSGNGREGCQP